MLAGKDKYDEIKKIPLHDRFLFLEMKYPGREDACIQKLNTVATPRADKTHLPYRMIRRWIEEHKVKTILTTRNPKDTMVSMYYFVQQLKCEFQ